MPAPDLVDTIPLAMDDNGSVWVSGTRVTLDVIMAAFQEGAIPEQIVQQYPSVPLGDVYQVIGYCLRHSEEINAYLLCRKQDAQAIKADNEQRWSPDGVRDRLLARRLKQPCRYTS